jgi:hypothetical protein
VDAAKDKEEQRKERERELNRAKYERRKLREKARKEEERRRQEEEQRKVSTVAPPLHPSSEIRDLVPNSSPIPSTLAIIPQSLPPVANSITASPLNPRPQHLHPIIPPVSHPPSHRNYMPPIAAKPVSSTSNQTSVSRFIPRPPAPQKIGSPPIDHRTQVHTSPYPPHTQPPSYTSVRPASHVEPYWSPYTTNSTLPNGQSFVNGRTHHPVHTNGTTPSTATPRNIAIRPANNHSLQSGTSHHSGPVQQPQLGQGPVIHPRSFKSPEVQRSSLPGASYSSSGIYNNPKQVSLAPISSNGHVLPTLQPSNNFVRDESGGLPHIRAVSGTPNAEHVSTLARQPISQQANPVFQPQQIPQLNLNGSTYQSQQRTLPSLTTEIPMQGSGLGGKEDENGHLTNGVITENVANKSEHGIVNENERTKMSFLLN